MMTPKVSEITRPTQSPSAHKTLPKIVFRRSTHAVVFRSQDVSKCRLSQDNLRRSSSATRRLEMSSSTGRYRKSPSAHDERECRLPAARRKVVFYARSASEGGPTQGPLERSTTPRDVSECRLPTKDRRPAARPAGTRPPVLR